MPVEMRQCSNSKSHGCGDIHWCGSLWTPPPTQQHRNNKLRKTRCSGTIRTSAAIYGFVVCCFVLFCVWFLFLVLLCFVFIKTNTNNTRVFRLLSKCWFFINAKPRDHSKIIGHWMLLPCVVPNLTLTYSKALT